MCYKVSFLEQKRLKMLHRDPDSTAALSDATKRWLDNKPDKWHYEVVQEATDGYNGGISAYGNRT